MPIALETTSLTDSLAMALRSMIIAGEVEPGQRLSTATIAEQFGVSQITARAGIDRLVAEGLLRRGQRKTAHVPKLAAVDIVDIYRSRGPIEELAVTMLAESATIPEAADRALARMTAASRDGKHADHTEADIALHRALINATGSVRLRRMHDSVMGEAQLCIAQVRKHEGLDLAGLTERHAAILSAIRAGDAAAAAQALYTDLDSCRETLLADLASSGQALRQAQDASPGKDDLAAGGLR